MTNKEIFQYYKEQLKLNKYKDSFSIATLNTYLPKIERFVDYLDDNGLELLNVKQYDILDFFDYMDLTPSLFASYKSAIFNLYQLLGESREYRRLVEYNPASSIKNPKVSHHIKKPFSEKEIEILLSHSKDIKQKAMFNLLFDTGLRISELTSLTIKQYKEKTVDNFMYLKGKGGNTRLIHLSDTSIELIDSYLSTRENIKDDECLFLSKHNLRYSTSILNRQFKALGERANIKGDLVCHNTRKSAATNMLNDGKSLEVVQLFLGHKSITTTGIYAQLNVENYKNAILQ